MSSSMRDNIRARGDSLIKKKDFDNRIKEKQEKIENERWNKIFVKIA